MDVVIGGEARPLTATSKGGRRMHVFQRYAVVIALVFALFPASDVRAAQKGHVALTDAQIKGDIEHKLSELDLGSGHVTVTVKDGVATLMGTVPNLWLKQEAINRARKADDVNSVVSQLTVASAENDSKLADEIGKRLRRYVFYTIYDDVEGTVKNGVVTLTGKVTMPYKADEIVDLVSRIQGVREVRNEIQTLPTSTFDDQLRVAIASQIYRDPLFWNYGLQANPPIHVVVEHGRVTLTGVVNSEVERRKAETIARTTFGVMDVTNQLRLDHDVPRAE
jgi:osmotically-inducible protein OsmY